MRKRIACILAALALCLQGTALGAEAEGVTLSVQDAQGLPMPGVEVTVYDQSEAMRERFTTDETGMSELSGLAAGTYTAEAKDPTDGYATRQTFTVPGAIEVTLVLRKLESGSEITVGNMTKVNGSFFTDMWGNNTSDIDVRSMLAGYQTVAWSAGLSAVLDTSVVSVNSMEKGRGGAKTYTFTVADGLKYNDGTAIDARDYVFSILLQSAPQTVEIGGMAYGYSHLAGFEAYNTGKSEVFSGVRLLSNRQFSMTISGEYLPYYYELVYLNVQPYPIGVLAPGCEVADEGAGAFIRPLSDEQGNPLGEFSAAVLQETILNPDTGYLSHPQVTSGPYQLEKYDAESGTVSFTVNPNYVGNHEGQRPLIERVRLAYVERGDALERLKAGEIDILNKVTDVQVINGAAQMRDEEGTAALTTYLRSGQAFLGLACEQGPTSYTAVRQAISHCVDEATLATDYAGTYGLPVYSHYGLGQWMATGYLNTMNEQVTTYPCDVEAAKALLEKGGWKYNAEGKAYAEGTDTVRYRKLSQKELEAYKALESPVVECIQVGKSWYLPLELRFANVEGSGLCAKVQELIIPRLEEAGFHVVSESVGFTEMLRSYYRQNARTYNLYALASNFTFVYDPYFEFNGEARYQGELNRSGINDKQLLKLAKALRETEPNDQETYTKRWLSLMAYYSEILPTVPLYSNMYADIRASDVQGYEPNNFWNWPSAILHTWRDDAPGEEQALTDQLPGVGLGGGTGGGTEEEIVLVE